MDFLPKKILIDIVLKACLETGLSLKVAQSVVEKVVASVTPETVDKEQIIKLFKEGKSISENARRCLCSRAYVYKVLREARLVG